MQANDNIDNFLCLLTVLCLLCTLLVIICVLFLGKLWQLHLILEFFVDIIIKSCYMDIISHFEYANRELHGYIVYRTF